jgi:hypothetical protein
MTKFVERTGLKSRVTRWHELCQTLINKNFDNSPLRIPQLRCVGGNRYLKFQVFDDWNREAQIASGVTPKESSRAFAFIDVTNGDILKPATWRAPAKHARGNVFDDDYGMSHMTPHGPEYLK